LYESSAPKPLAFQGFEFGRQRHHFVSDRMYFRPITTLVAVAVCALSLVPVACAQDIDSLRLRADRHLNAGEYADARRLYERVLEADPEHVSALDFARTFLLTGGHREGLEAVDRLLQVRPRAPYLLQARGRLLRAEGRLDEAATAFTAAVEHRNGALSGLVDLAEMWELSGRESGARQLLAAAFEPFVSGSARTVVDLRAAASAAIHFGRFRDANEAYRLAHELDPSSVETLYQWAELFRSKYNDADARRTYEEALQRDPRHAPSLVGLALSTHDFERSEELAQRALESNPQYAPALNVLAGIRILDGHFDEAAAAVRRALAADPNNLESLGHLASIYLLTGDSTAYIETERRALARNAHTGAFYRAAAENATHRFRYGIAATLLERSVRSDPTDARARADLGTAQFRLGLIDEARRNLAQAFELDPFNLFASNSLTLLDDYENFARLRSPRFEVVIHESESDVLGPLVLALAEEAYAALRERYPYDPDGPIRIEAFNNGDDFAVRIAGVPHRGLLGVSFGDVLALNTPAAQEEGGYNWARTLWHEIAHTMALGVSDHHVPRWFTEGLSVYEEARARQEWARDMELTFLSVFASGLLLPLSEIERGFTRPQFPGQVILSYYHAGQFIQYLADEFGFDAVRAALEAYRGGAGNEEAIRAATGETIEEVDRRFRQSVEARHGRLSRALEGMPDALGNEGAEVESISNARGPFFGQLDEAQASLSSGDVEAAEQAYTEALAMYPEYVGPGNAYQGLADIYRAKGDAEALQEVLEGFVARAESAHSELLELANILEARQEADRAAALRERSLEVDPYASEVRRRLADYYEATGRFEAAIRHRRAEVSLDPADRAGALFRLARALNAGGIRDEARRAVLQSLEAAPDYRDAQKLLLRIVDS